MRLQTVLTQNVNNELKCKIFTIDVFHLSFIKYPLLVTWAIEIQSNLDFKKY